jgi:predicted small metal-binding protein
MAVSLIDLAQPAGRIAGYPGFRRLKEKAMKRIQCGDLVPGCTFKAQAETDAEVLHMTTDHVRNAHNIEVTPQFLQRARERIQDVQPSAAEKKAG